MIGSGIILDKALLIRDDRKIGNAIERADARKLLTAQEEALRGMFWNKLLSSSATHLVEIAVHYAAIVVESFISSGGQQARISSCRDGRSVCDAGASTGRLIPTRILSRSGI